MIWWSSANGEVSILSWFLPFCLILQAIHSSGTLCTRLRVITADDSLSFLDSYSSSSSNSRTSIKWHWRFSISSECLGGTHEGFHCCPCATLAQDLVCSLVLWRLVTLSMGSSIHCISLVVTHTHTWKLFDKSSKSSTNLKKHFWKIEAVLDMLGSTNISSAMLLVMHQMLILIRYFLDRYLIPMLSILFP